MDDEPERGHLPREQRCVTRRRAVGDHGTVAGESLEAGDAAGGVDEHVSRGQEVAHRVGEAEHLHARFPGEPGLEPHASRRIASGEADHGRVELERRRHGSREVADAPAATGDDDDRPFVRQAERAGPRRTPAACGTPEPPAATRDVRCRARRRARRPDEALVHDEVQVDALVGPELEAREVGDRRAGGNEHLAAQAQRAEDQRRGRPGRDDDVGRAPADESQHRARADQRERRPREPPQHAAAAQAPEEQREQPGRGVQLPAVGVVQDPPQRCRELGQHVSDGHLRARVPPHEILGEDARSRQVPLADRRREHEDANRPTAARHDPTG